MKRFFKLFLVAIVATVTFTSCEKGCICRNLNTGATEELYGVYSKKECESYTEYYKTIYKLDNVDCSYEIRK
jgi:hypothetical protein